MALTLSIKQKIYSTFAILLACALLSALVYQRLSHRVTQSVEQNAQLIESLVLANQGIEGHIVNAQHLVSQSLHTPVETLDSQFSSYLSQVQGIANFMIYNMKNDEGSSDVMSEQTIIFIELIARLESLAQETAQQFGTLIDQASPIIAVKTLSFADINALTQRLQRQLIQQGRKTPAQFPDLSQRAVSLSDGHLRLVHYLQQRDSMPSAALLKRFAESLQALRKVPGISQEIVSQLYQQGLLHMEIHQARLTLKQNIDNTIGHKLQTLLELLEDVSQAVITYNESTVADLKTHRNNWLLTTSLALALVLLLASWIAWRLVSGLMLIINQLRGALLGLSAGELAVAVPHKDSKDELGEIARAIHHLKLRLIERNGFELANDAIKKRMESILLNAPVGLIEINNEGTIVLANNEIKSQLKYTDAQLLGQKVASVLRGDFSAAYDNYLDSRHHNNAQRDVAVLNLTDSLGVNLKAQVSLDGFELDQTRYVIASVLNVTALYQAQEDAIAQQSLLEEIINDAPEAMIITTPQRIIKIVNPAFSKTFGYRSADVIGKSTQFLYENTQAYENAGAVKYNPEPSDDNPILEISYRKQDGSLFLSETVGGAIRDKKNHLIGYMAFVRDISKRKQAEKKLEKYRQQVNASNHILKMATQSVNMGIWNYDVQQEKLHWNDEMFSIFGSDPAAFKQSLEDGFDKVHPDDIASTTQTLNDALAKKCNFDTDFRIIHPQKGIRHINAHASMSLNEAGEVERIIGVNWDQTEQKNKEAQLKQLALVASSTHNAVAICDPDGSIKWVNAAFTRITGYEAQEITGLNLSNLLTGANTDPDTLEYFEAQLAEGEDAHGDIINYHKHGREYWAAIDIQAIKDEDGNTSEFIEVQTDITHKKLAEQNLHDAVAKAEVLAIAAEQASVAKSEFLANMSHEIRTPMNGVLGMLNLLMRTEQNPQQQRYASLAHNSAESLLVLINDILDFSKIEAGKLELESIDFDLIKVISEFSATYAYRVHEKNLEYIVQLADDLPKIVTGDPTRIRQVITNLCANALKFTSLGEIHLSVSVVDEQLIRFEISDTGIGIPPAKTKKLFSKFTQVDGSTTRQYGGTGLGLSISKQLCQLMGGEVGVDSIEGQGSTFWFTVRLPASQKVNQVAVPHLSLHDTNILVVDDNQTNREVVGGLLTSWGASVDYAALPHIAHQMLTDHKDKYRLVILDMQMPEEDGLSLLKRLQDNLPFTQTYFLLMTSVVLDMPVTAIKELGLSGILNKPVMNIDLHKALAIIIEHGKAFEETQRLVTKSSLQALDADTKKLLLVEDNLINQEVAKSILEEFGYSIDTAENGEIAIAMLNKNTPYGAVLMDCQMPIMDGYQTTENIRQGMAGAHNQDITIIAMTANAMKGDREKCLACGMDDYLTKPLDILKLEKLLQHWLKEGKD
ncbi:MAG: PAS domain S-box protein [Bermanella sp.]